MQNRRHTDYEGQFTIDVATDDGCEAGSLNTAKKTPDLLIVTNGGGGGWVKT